LRGEEKTVCGELFIDPHGRTAGGFRAPQDPSRKAEGIASCREQTSADKALEQCIIRIVRVLA
jgi:hypothetical protein